MARITFYEKPGCQTNAAQKAMLAAAGHDVTAKDLLAEPWTPDDLRRFFRDVPVSAWFNRASPRVKSGALDPGAFDAAAALAALIEDPLLIRRPLMEIEGARIAGFDRAVLEASIGLDDPDASEECLGSGEPCPAPAAS